MTSTPFTAYTEWPELEIAHRSLDESFRRLTCQTDSILLEAAVVRLAAVQEEVRSLAEGKVVFTATEGWRTVYEELLRAPGLECYRSVAWIRNEDYWRDTPGRRSMQMNFQAIQNGVRIERILILNDFFWPAAARQPTADVCRWIDEQYDRGTSIGLVRESDLDTETDLLCDIGIYGSRATGTLELDSQCRTTRFTFDFSPDGIRLAGHYHRLDCDGLFLSAVTYHGVQLPVRQLIEALGPGTRPRFVVIDGAQALNHVPLGLADEYSDLLLAGCHKWLRAYQPLGLAFCCRRSSERFVAENQREMLASGELDDPLLTFTAQLELGATESYSETVNLSPMFTAAAAVRRMLSSPRAKRQELAMQMTNADRVADQALAAG